MLRWLLFLLLPSSLFLASFSIASPAYATSHCSGYVASKGDAQCYCFPVTVSATVNSCAANGHYTSVSLTWDGNNCGFYQYNIYNGSSVVTTGTYGPNGSTTVTGNFDPAAKMGVSPHGCSSSGCNDGQTTYDSSPTVNCAPTDTPVPAATATVTPSPTPSGPTATPTPIYTSADITLHVEGIDQSNISNTVPTPGKHGQQGWPFTLYVYGATQNFSTTPLKTFNDIATENTSDPTNPLYGTFQNQSFAMTGLATGTYKFLVSTPMGSLRTQVGGGTFQITGGKNNPLVTIDPNNPTLQGVPYLTMGDITGDNQIDVQDYSIMLDCYGYNSTTSACLNDAKALKNQSKTLPSDFLPGDLNDNSKVDGIDFNMLLRGPFGQIGAGGIQTQ